MEASDNNFTDKLINSLKTAATEIEELRVQVALGKAEAKDIFEDLKKKFNQKISGFKAEYAKIVTDKNILPVINAFEQLQVQLSLGIAETKELFEDQVKKINKALTHLEGSLNHDLLYDRSAEIQLEIEKFKIKLELLSLHFKLKKVKAEYNFQQKKNEFDHKIDELHVKLIEKKLQAKEKWNFFRKEIDEAFSHLKKAFDQ